MRFRVKNISKGYCEVWGNEQRMACVMYDEGMWHWSAKHNEPPFFMPFYTYEFKTRRECVNHCIRTALLRQAKRAIEGGKGLSHCPCRSALHDMQRSHLFSSVEMHEMRERME